CGLWVDGRERRAVWEMTAVVEGTEGDFAFDDPEQGGAPAPVLEGVHQLCELPAPHPAPPEVEEQPAVLGSNAHAGDSVPSGASRLPATCAPRSSGTWRATRTSPGPDACSNARPRAARRSPSDCGWYAQHTELARRVDARKGRALRSGRVQMRRWQCPLGSPGRGSSSYQCRRGR